MISKRVFVKALSEMDMLDSIFKDHDVQDILEELNNPDKMKYHVFMQELLMNACIKQATYDKKHFNPDVEYLKKHPDTQIFMTND